MLTIFDFSHGFQGFSIGPRAPGSPGAFAVYKGEEPAVTGNIRLRLSTVDNRTPLVAHLSALVVKHGGLSAKRAGEKGVLTVKTSTMWSFLLGNSYAIRDSTDGMVWGQLWCALCFLHV